MSLPSREVKWHVSPKYAGVAALKRAISGAECCGPEKGRFVAASSFVTVRWMRTGNAGENSQGSGETGGLTDGLLFVRLGGESAGSARCVRGQCRRPTVRSVAVCCMVRDAYTGRVDCLQCVELLPSQVGLLPWWTLAESGAADGTADTDHTDATDASVLEARIFIPLPLGWVRASWRRSWSCGCWLASACVGVRTARPQAAVYKYCLCLLHVVCLIWPKEFACLLDCDRRSLAVCMTVSEGRSLVVCLTVGGSHRGLTESYHHITIRIKLK
jgi:hypothetical protein